MTFEDSNYLDELLDNSLEIARILDWNKAMSAANKAEPDGEPPVILVKSLIRCAAEAIASESLEADDFYEKYAWDMLCQTFAEQIEANELDVETAFQTAAL